MKNILDKHNINMKDEYQCKDCGYKTGILTLGDIYQGCSKCGGHSGFLENGKDKNHKTPESDKLNNYLSK